ncbi:SUMF1/EgtB/PvdO family nonheme iron enzyme [Bythopirellula polymerisocia]|uniref:Serine/threonine-protein kinase pkn1 n=1 Tax=Bythopirellula polymerisocia TaxID=2528003 RepID=A0A5C6C9K0_9BACT|nr:SUMF1/EgtB/PvdO family nonheme iron enzyme [Bythopirellula polymerisocia]TWU21403.1 Serine/threonine-protein kinase pkn1 [Bythopirellula polymerisocia]
MKKALRYLLLLVVAGGLVYALIPSGEDVAQKLDRANLGQAKHVAAVDAPSESVAIALSAENTKIGFTCAKNLAGKTVTVMGGWNRALGGQLQGRMLVEPTAKKLLQLELQVDVGSLWSEHDLLTDALLTKGFFQVEEHPQATFVSTSITPGAPENSAQEDATHQIEGNFLLNGIERSISFPAKIEFTPSGLTLHSKFSLQRKDFNVLFVDSGGFGLLTDDNISELVALDGSINATFDRTPEKQEPPETEEKAQSEELFALIDKRFGLLEEKLLSIEKKVAALEEKSQLEPFDKSEVESPANESTDTSKLSSHYIETIPATQVPFELILVPGDQEGGIPPLYVGKSEVTWDEFMPWVDGRDLESPDPLGELRAMKLRPSPPYGAVDRGFGMDRRPALSMSRLSAELYCQWLSEQTGKTYRLPTEKEWEHIYQLGGGNLNTPPTAEEAERLAVYVDNSFDEDIDDWATKPTASGQPNNLGIYDLAGNVCEWVTETGEERVARGGHFDSDREELGVGRHVEHPDWNRDYPNNPKSIWWFVNAPWVGFRVVAEVQ